MIVSDTHDAWYVFFTDLGDRGGETAIISIRRAALAIRAKKILVARAETDAPLADFQCKSQSSSGNKGGQCSYCQSRNRLMAMCMRVRSAICLANTCRHSDCFRYTGRACTLPYQTISALAIRKVSALIARAALAIVRA